MQLVIKTTVDLAEASADAGFVTWLRVKVVRLQGETGKRCTIGQARVALLHLGAIESSGSSLLEVLDADSAVLEALLDVYFGNDGALKERFEQGAGSDMLYVADVEMRAAWRGRGIELAVVRRLCDTLGAGCELAVVPYDDAAKAGLWASMGFQITRPPTGDRPGYLHLALAFRHPRVAPSDDDDSFKTLANPESGKRHH